MYIISKKKDYYDNVVEDHDKGLIFKRDFEEIKKFTIPENLQLNHWNFSAPDSPYVHGRNISCQPIGIAFCGKLYLGYQFTYPGSVYDEVVYEYKYDKILETFTKLWEKDSRRERFSEQTIKNLKEVFEKYNKKPFNYFFKQFNTPYVKFFIPSGSSFWHRESVELQNVEINPVLKDYQFYKVFDPFTARQEVEMYLSGVLGVSDKPMIEISDTDRLLSKGFDKVWSFRNPDPPKRKQKK